MKDLENLINSKEYQRESKKYNKYNSLLQYLENSESKNNCK